MDRLIKKSRCTHRYYFDEIVILFFMIWDKIE